MAEIRWLPCKRRGNISADTIPFECITGGSGLARECGGSVNVDVECDTAFASKPAPTLVLFPARNRLLTIHAARQTERVQIPQSFRQQTIREALVGDRAQETLDGCHAH